MTDHEFDQTRDGQPVPRAARKPGTSASCRLPKGTTGTDHGYGETRPHVDRRGEWDQSAGDAVDFDQSQEGCS